MRLHLIIVRHGLPATRILWTTTASTYGSHVPAPASAIASSRTPNIAYSNGGYTIAQLLEDVNEVVPLETEPNVFDPEFSSRWGLEDYVVEVGGSECLHFMELEGILRDGDEVVIRALQIADMRARRLCGRHQITADGKHLIDGVPFGLPFKQRNTSNRPAIAIPPRKKRRTMLSSWDQDPGYTFDDQNGDEDGDGDWLPAGENGLGKELSILPAEHDMSLGTVIRHPVDHSADEDSEDADGYEIAEDELESELKALKEDFEEVTSHHMDIQSQVEQIPEPSSRRPTSAGNRPGSSGSLHRGSVIGASSLSSKRSRGDDSSPRVSKAVRFNRGEDLPEQPRPIQGAKSQPGDISLDMPDGDSASDSDFDSAEDSDVSSSEGSEVSEAESSSSSEEGDSSSDEESSDSEDSSSSDDSSSEEDSSSDEAPTPKKPRHSMAPPGQGSVRTKKSNNRFKLRRRLSKLKELGVLPDDADFAALRSWEEKNGGFPFIDDSSIMTTPISKSEKKEQEQRDFEARRQKLLDDLARGGVDVEEASEKENVPPRPPTVSEPAPKPAASEEPTNENPEAERPNRRALDIASTRRLLFGSLGVRTPKTKADEEATRKKLAAQFKTHTKRPKEEEAPVKEDDAQADPNWQKKLIIKATECIFPDIKLTAPPYPFVNRWDNEADAIIRERLGWNKKRKRKQRIQVYENDYEEYQDEAYGEWDDTQLNYDEQNYDQEHYDQEEEQVAVVDDLPALPEDPNSLPDLLEAEVKPGAIIAFRQLDMSKDTNWQPLMSEFRVAEVREVDDGTIHVELAVRDRKAKREDPDPDNDEPREYAGFEMPGFDDDEEDDGLRELVFAELSDPKLLTPAPPQDNESQNKEKENDENVVQEDSIVSVIEDSMPNAQLAPPTDMDLDETTFVTLVTANESPDRTSDITSIRVSGRGVPTIQGLEADDEQSDSLMVPSPSFSGFHSAQSSPGNRLFNNVGEESNILDGHTLIEEHNTTLADISNQDISFLSANEQSASNTHTQSQEQHDRQVVEELQVPAGANGSGNDSLLSIVHAEADANSFASKTSPARSFVEESPDVRRDYAGEASDDWEEIAEALGNSSSPHDNTDQDKDKSMNNTDDEDKDSLLHSNQSLDLSPHPSPPTSSLSSRKPPPSAQRDSSQPTPKAKKSKVSLKRKTDPTASPNATSTRSKPSGRATDSQIPLPRVLDFIDLTQSSAPNTPGVHSPTADDDPQPPIKLSQSSASKVQRMTEVSITPKSQKKSKRRSSRKL